MHLCMNAIPHIRKNVLNVSQAAFAAITGANQATVSRWENGELTPDLEQLRAIRAEAKRLGLEWDDSWFFETPNETSEPATGEAA